MNTSPASVVGIADRLSIGISRTSIRHFTPPKRPRTKRHNLTGFRPGHGEQIFVYNHIENGMVLYSHKPELKRDDSTLEQIPFTVKKQKPAILRRDYWQPMCMIQFDQREGLGAFIGRSVFRHLREFRRLHELSWGWQKDAFLSMNKWERGQAIHNQKSNAVADIAAVLAGEGRGSLMWTTDPPEKEVEEQPSRKEGDRENKGAGAIAGAPPNSEAAASKARKGTSADASKTALTATPSAPKKVDKNKKIKMSVNPLETPARLQKATIYWANDVDLDWARSWSANVSHKFGLPNGVKVWNWKTKLLRQDYGEEDEEVEFEDDKKVEVKPEASKVKTAKAWLGSLVGKIRGSSSEARV